MNSRPAYTSLARPKQTILLTAILAIAIGRFCPGSEQMTKRHELPISRKEAVVETLHGVKVEDPYRWLEDRTSSDTRQWIDAQNEYTDAILGRIEGRDALKQRLTELMRIDVIGIPHERNGRYFITRRKADQDLAVICMREGLDGETQVLIDPHGMSEDNTVSVNIQDLSIDGKRMLYGVRQGGEDELTIRLFDVDARKNLEDELPRARYYGAQLTRDNKAIYYTKQTDDGPRVYLHTIGTGVAGDREVFGEGYGTEKIIFASISEDGRHLLIHVLYGSAGDQTEIYYKNLAEDGPIVTAVKDIEARFFGTMAGDRLYVHTNWDAPRWKILAVDAADLPTSPGQWQTILPEGEGVLEDFSTVGGRLFANHLENVVSKLRMYEPDGTLIRELELPIGEASGVSGRWDGDEAFFSFSSFTSPPTIYRYDLEGDERTVWSKLDIPIRLKESEVAVRQVWYVSKDGTKVPMFLVHRDGIRLDGGNPALLTGYGGFNASLTPGYSSLATIWLEYGGVYARPSLRGGGEFGEEWHKAGMIEKKQNVFDDFLSAAEWLIENRYTNPDRLAISGGSNGGLLVGAALTQRPDLFEAVACFYPLLDMVRYHKFLVARYWVPEYGSSEDPEQFKTLLDYSPYHNILPGENYPAVIFVTGDADTRVAPLHARKMAARLQAATSSENPVVVDYDTKAGHSGGMPLTKQIQDTTDWLGFVMWQLGMLEEKDR